MRAPDGYFGPYSLARDAPCISLDAGRLTPQALGAWIDVPVSLASSFVRDDPLATYEPLPAYVERLREAFANFDAAIFPLPNGKLTPKQKRLVRGKLLERRRAARPLLERTLRDGLERRQGRQLWPREMLAFRNFLARGIDAPGLRVCEACEYVFGGTRAAFRCPECRKAPVRIMLQHESRREGAAPLTLYHVWHFDFSVALRRVPRGQRVRYFGRCTRCKVLYSTTDSRRRTCRNCGGSNAAYARASRGLSRTGRQLFAFASAPGRPVLAGAAGLHAHDGVVRTADAEIAAKLRLDTLDPDPSLVELADPRGPDPHPDRPATWELRDVLSA